MEDSDPIRRGDNKWKYNPKCGCCGNMLIIHDHLVGRDSSKIEQIIDEIVDEDISPRERLNEVGLKETSRIEKVPEKRGKNPQTRESNSDSSQETSKTT
jgi:hypothetical protein